MKYLTEMGKELLLKQIEKVNKNLIVNGIARNDDIKSSERMKMGNYNWRMTRRYLDGLEYLLDMESEEDEKTT